MAGPVLEQAVQDVPVVGRRDVERDVVEAAEQPVHGDRVEVVGCDVGLEGVGDEGAVAVVVEVAARDADDPVAGGQLALAVAVVERREQLAERQVAGAAEHREVTVLGQGAQLGSRGGGLFHAVHGLRTFGSIQALFGIFQDKVTNLRPRGSIRSHERHLPRRPAGADPVRPGGDPLRAGPADRPLPQRRQRPGHRAGRRRAAARGRGARLHRRPTARRPAVQRRRGRGARRGRRPLAQPAGAVRPRGPRDRRRQHRPHRRDRPGRAAPRHRLPARRPPRRGDPAGRGDRDEPARHGRPRAPGQPGLAGHARLGRRRARAVPLRRQRRPALPHQRHLGPGPLGAVRAGGARPATYSSSRPRPASGSASSPTAGWSTSTAA